MKKKIRYDRVMIVVLMIIGIGIIVVYMFLHRNHFYEYNGDIETYVGTYQQDDKIYTFDLKGFVLDEENYLSLNDMYNMMIIVDDSMHVYLDTTKHTLTYQMQMGNYYFDYGQDKIVYNNECIDVKDYQQHIYISGKNIYLSVSLIEKTILKSEKKIKIENKNAIIE